MTTIKQPFQCNLPPQLQETHRTTHHRNNHSLQKHVAIRDRNDRSRTRRTHEVPFIVACSHFTRKNTRFRAPASSPKHSPCNIHAAITMRFAAHSCKKRMELRTQEQPLFAKHIGGTIRDRNDRPPHTPSHTRGTFHRRLQPFYTEKHKVLCSGFFLENIAYATFMQPLQCVSPAHSCKKRIELRTLEQPLVAETHRRNNSRQKRPQPAPVAHTRYLSSPAAAILHGKTQGFVLRLPPQNIAHATFMQPLQCVWQHPVANLHLSTHVATSDDDNQAAIPMQSATTASRNA